MRPEPTTRQRLDSQDAEPWFSCKSCGNQRFFLRITTVIMLGRISKVICDKCGRLSNVNDTGFLEERGIYKEVRQKTSLRLAVR